MSKNKFDFPIILTTKHVSEIMECSSTTAAKYINVASAELRKKGKLAPIDVVKNLRIPRDAFFEIYGI